MKNKYFPVVLVLMVTFVLALFADETLFEDINMSGYLKQGNGVSFFPAATTGASTNNAITQIHAGTTGLWNSASSAGFYRFGRMVLQERANDFLMGDSNLLNNVVQEYSIMFPKTTASTFELRGQPASSVSITLGPNFTPAFFTTNEFRIGITNEWLRGRMSFNLLEIQGRDGLLANSLIISNYGNIVNNGDLISSNFHQKVGSAGGFVGNGSGLTNLPGSAIAGFTPGSTIFAGSSGSLSEDNANYFWDITNRRLGVGINSGLLAKVHVVATNGVVFTYMGDSYSTTTNPEDAAGFIGRRARGTVAVPSAVQSGDILSIFTGRGYGTTGFSSIGRSRMQMEASETWTDTAQGSRVVFYVTPVTTTNTFEAIRIHNDGSVGIGTNTIVSATKLYVNGSIGASTSVYAGGSPLISATNTFIGVSIGGVTGDLSAIYTTNVLADFASTLTLTNSDLSFSVPSSIITNMVVNIGRPSTELNGWSTSARVSSNGFVTIRGQNVTAGTIDQGSLPYTIHVLKVPTVNTLP